MGLIKKDELPNGVKLEYYRIASLTTVVGVQTVIELTGYTSQAKREEEQAAIVDPGGSPCDVYVETQYLVVEYDPDMSVNKAYALLKAMPEWEDAEDVIDKWAAGTAYYIGDLVMDGEQEYECIQSHTSQEGYEPHATPALWKVHEKGGDGIPVWVQPTGSQDAYRYGDHVMHNGMEWVSTYDGANVWEPGVYGWENVEGGE